MKINEAGRQIVESSESLRLNAYPDPASPRAKHKRETGTDDPKLSGAPWTIGYGHTGDVHEGDQITEHQAEVLLEYDLESAEEIVTKNVTYKINQNQFSALVSFVFNVGPGKKDSPGKKDGKDGFVTLRDGTQSSMLRRLNAGGPLAASNEFSKWTHAGVVELPGLVKRRAAEKALFLESVS